jgi:hypothetical protein
MGTSHPVHPNQKLAGPSSLVTSCDRGRRRCRSVVRVLGRHGGASSARRGDRGRHDTMVWVARRPSLRRPGGVAVNGGTWRCTAP